MIRCSPAKVASTNPSNKRYVASLMQTEFGVARACKRDATFTVSPAALTAASAPPCPNYRQSSIEADPKLRPDAVFGFEIAAGGLQPLQDRAPRGTRAVGRPQKRWAHQRPP